LNGYAAHCERLGLDQIEELDAYTVARFLEDCCASQLAARSQARTLSALRGWFRFLVRERLLPDDPTILAPRPRFSARLPHAPTRDQIEALLQAPAGETPRATRDCAMLMLLYASGLRVSELLGLKLEDLDLMRGTLRVRGKGEKERLVPMGEPALQQLRKHLAQRDASKAAARSRLVFVSPRGGALTRQWVWKMVGAYANAALPDGRHLHPHQIRHAFATHLLVGGADLRSLQTLLGHSDITTTQIYTDVADTQLAAVHRRTHPRG
jgi:integrase/recombinase XerD